MKNIIVVLSCLFVMGLAHAEETVGESATATKNNAKRALKKGANRVKEMVCAEGDAKCLAKKAQHRMQETGDTAKDKIEEGVNKVD